VRQLDIKVLNIIDARCNHEAILLMHGVKLKQFYWFTV